MEWSDKSSIELVHKVRELDNLWDSHYPDKKKNARKTDSWKKISEDVSQSPEDCHKKWKHLSQSYRKYRCGKKGTLDQGANVVLKITQFAYKTIHSFMNDVYKPHGTTDAVRNLSYSFKESSFKVAKSTSTVPNYKKLVWQKSIQHSCQAFTAYFFWNVLKYTVAHLKIIRIRKWSWRIIK